MDELFLFEGIADDQILQMRAMLGEPKVFEKGDVIYGGERCGAIGVLLSGGGECVAQSGGVLMKVFESGEVFGAASVFGGEAASRITASTRSVVQFIDRETLLSWFTRFPQTSVNYIRFLSARVRFLNRKIALLTMDSAQARLMEYLTNQAGEAGVVRIQNMTQLAKTIGVGRTSLYRSLDALCETGWITRENHQNYLREKSV